MNLHDTRRFAGNERRSGVGHRARARRHAAAFEARPCDLGAREPPVRPRQAYNQQACSFWCHSTLTLVHQLVSKKPWSWLAWLARVLDTLFADLVVAIRAGAHGLRSPFTPFVSAFGRLLTPRAPGLCGSFGLSEHSDGVLTSQDTQGDLRV